MQYVLNILVLVNNRVNGISHLVRDCCIYQLDELLVSYGLIVVNVVGDVDYLQEYTVSSIHGNFLLDDLIILLILLWIALVILVHVLVVIVFDNHEHLVVQYHVFPCQDLSQGVKLKDFYFFFKFNIDVFGRLCTRYIIITSIIIISLTFE